MGHLASMDSTHGLGQLAEYRHPIVEVDPFGGLEPLVEAHGGRLVFEHDGGA